MTNSKPSMSIIIRQIQHILENAGIDPKNFMQTIIDNHEFQKNIIRQYRDTLPPVVTELPAEPKNLDVLASTLTGHRYQDIMKLRRDIAPYIRDETILDLRLSEAVQGNRALDETVSFLKASDHFVAIFHGLEARPISIIVMTLGLTTGSKLSISKVAESHSISYDQAYHIANSTVQRMRNNYEWLRRILPKNPLDLRVEDFDVSSRLRNLLRRHQFHTLRQIVECTEEELLQISYIGPASLSDLKEELARLGLNLKQ